MNDGIVLTCPECSSKGTFKTTSIDTYKNYIGYQCQECFFLAPEDDEWLIAVIQHEATVEEQAQFFQRQQRRSKHD